MYRQKADVWVDGGCSCCLYLVLVVVVVVVAVVVVVVSIVDHVIIIEIIVLLIIIIGLAVFTNCNATMLTVYLGLRLVILFKFMRIIICSMALVIRWSHQSLIKIISDQPHSSDHFLRSLPSKPCHIPCSSSL